MKRALCRSVEDAVGKSTGDKIAGATGAYVKLRAERKLGGRAEALAVQTVRRSYALWRPAGVRKSTGDTDRAPHDGKATTFGL